MSGPAQTRATRRWHGVGALSLLTTAVGVVTNRPGLLLVAVVGVALAAYSRGASTPDPTLVLERSLDTSHPTAGETATVTVTVENTGETTVADLRLADGVPPGVDVVEGTPQVATALRPDATARYEYEVQAVRGDHAFGPATGVARDVAGARERRLELDAETPTRLVCSPRLRPVNTPALRELTTRHSGPQRTAIPGSGTEFVTVREYRRGDPISRLDWRRRARTGELTTVEFAERRSLSVLLLVDAREVAYAAPDDGDGETAVQQCVDAAGRLFAGLLDAGHEAGVAALSSHECWLSPRTGPRQRARGRAELTRNPAFGRTPPPADVDLDREVARVEARLTGGTQVVVLSPLVDDDVTHVARRLDAAGHRLSVLSPDVTGTATAGEQAARLERGRRVRSLRGRGVPVLDWPPNSSIASALLGGWHR